MFVLLMHTSSCLTLSTVRELLKRQTKLETINEKRTCDLYTMSFLCFCSVLQLTHSSTGFREQRTHTQVICRLLRSDFLQCILSQTAFPHLCFPHREKDRSIPCAVCDVQPRASVSHVLFQLSYSCFFSTSGSSISNTEFKQ